MIVSASQETRSPAYTLDYCKLMDLNTAPSMMTGTELYFSKVFTMSGMKRKGMVSEVQTADSNFT